ncbi:putative ubx domain-containing protein [Erysiphe neolycopersici]|uniref:Putative ubx domain-containing protein n=1 Tax=Erysiphe neolycopersici TaxID=212602 RepID=A0A420HS05_9PEZI|nr:putative ubx domain-containing protein [Erysiphe neolycopersici]
MFYEGDLQSAVSEAVKESKLVACFVTAPTRLTDCLWAFIDNGEESQLWETEFLQDHKVGRIKEMLSDQSILLRLETGSKEAGYLTAIFPIPKTPTLVVINSFGYLDYQIVMSSAKVSSRNGQLKEYLTSGVGKEEFQRRLKNVSCPDKPTPLVPSPTTPASEEVGQASTQPLTPTQMSNNPEASFTSKVEETPKNKEDEEMPEPKSQNSSIKSILQDQNNAFKKKKQQDRDERARILKRVEDDKINRRNEAARRKAERDRCDNTSAGEPTQVKPDRSISNVLSHDTSSLLIRLFDGSTMRTKFPCTATLSNEVRNCILQHQPVISDQPYVFKQVLSPLPNRKIEAAEETQSLRDLGCVPSATFILAPISVYTEAYSTGIGAKTSNIVGEVISNGWGLVRGGLGLVTGALGAVVGGSVADNRGNNYQQINNENLPVSQITSPTNIRTQMSRLEERNRVDEPQFYNGNSVNFQPRPNDHDEEQTKQE